jgi:hypothetical protein
MLLVGFYLTCLDLALQQEGVFRTLQKLIISLGHKSGWREVQWAGMLHFVPRVELRPSCGECVLGDNWLI